MPWFAKDIKTGLTTFNYRSEEFMAKPVFAGPWNRGHRCLVPCDGFFEFTGEKGDKQPWLLKPKDDRVMVFAGLWEQWRGPKNLPLTDPLLSFSIATCAPNATVAPIHNRMPVLFTREAEWDAWLHPDAVHGELHVVGQSEGLRWVLGCAHFHSVKTARHEPVSDFVETRYGLSLSALPG